MDQAEIHKTFGREDEIFKDIKRRTSSHHRRRSLPAGNIKIRPAQAACRSSPHQAAAPRGCSSVSFSVESAVTALHAAVDSYMLTSDDNYPSALNSDDEDEDEEDERQQDSDYNALMEAIRNDRQQRF